MKVCMFQIMNPKYPRKFKKPAVLGVSMDEETKAAVKARASTHNFKGKASPYVLDLIKKDLGLPGAPGLETVARDTLVYLETSEAPEVIVNNLKKALPAY